MRLHLIAFLLLSVIICKSSHSYETLSDDYSVLLSHLSNRYPVLSRLSQKQVNLESIEIAEPVYQFSSSIQYIEFNHFLTEYKILYIALDSQDFSIEQQPILNYSYNRPVTIEIEFRPSSLGVKSDFLVVLLSNNLYIYHLTGVCIESGFNLTAIQIFHQQSSYGVHDLLAFNPFDQVVDRINIKSKHKHISIEKTSNLLAPHQTQEIGIVRSYFSAVGNYFTSVEIVLGTFQFNVPVHVKVYLPHLDVNKKLDFGIVTSSNRILVEELLVSSFATSHIKIIAVNSLSKHFQVSFSPKNVPSLATDFPVCKVKFYSKNEGNFVGKLEIITAQQVYIVECFAIVSFGFIYLSESPLVINPNGKVSHFTEIKNKLGITLHYESFNTNDKSISIFPKDKNRVEILIDSQKKQNPKLLAKTFIGKIYFELPFTEPTLKFHTLIRNNHSEVLGPIILGPYSRMSHHKFTLIIENPNSFDIQFYNLSSLTQFTYNYQENSILEPYSTLSAEINFQVTSSLDDCIKISTSVGEFFIHVSYEMVKGNSRIRALYFFDVTPLKQNEEYLYLYNDYPLPLNIISITSTYKDINFDIVSSSVPSQKEMIISKAHFKAPLKTVPNIDWNKFLTYRDLATWKNVQFLCTGYQQIFEISVESDLVGFTKLPVFLSYQESQFPVKHFSQFSHCEVRETCSIFIQVENIFAFPVTLQLLPNSERLEDEIYSFDCEINADKKEDEDSFGYNGKRADKCRKKIDKEILFSDLNEENDENAHSLNLGIVEKVLKFFELIIGQKKFVASDNDAGNLWKNKMVATTKAYKTLQIGESAVLGPIFITPNFIGDVSVPLLLRNNYTVIQKIDLNVKATGSKLAIMKRTNYIFNGNTYISHKNSIKREQQKLLFHVLPEEFQSFYLTADQMMAPTFVRTFEVHNLGNSDLVIHKITFENDECSLFGFTINSCEISLLLKPLEIYSMQISYNPTLFIYSETLSILVYSSEGLKKFQLDHKLPDDTKFDYFLSLYSEELLVLTTSLLASCCIIIVKSLKKKQIKLKVYSSQDLHTSHQIQVLKRAFSNLIIQSQDLLTKEPERIDQLASKLTEPLTKNSNSQELVESIQVSSDSSTQIQSDPSLATDQSENAKIISFDLPKPKDTSDSYQFHHVKRSKTIKSAKLANVIKSSGKVKKVEAKLPEIIANNKYILAASKRSTPEEPAPKPKEPECDEDYYLDSYKTRNILFGLSNYGKSSLLEELSQD